MRTTLKLLSTAASNWSVTSVREPTTPAAFSSICADHSDNNEIQIYTATPIYVCFSCRYNSWQWQRQTQASFLSSAYLPGVIAVEVKGVAGLVHKFATLYCDEAVSPCVQEGPIRLRQPRLLTTAKAMEQGRCERSAPQRAQAVVSIATMPPSELPELEH